MMQRNLMRGVTGVRLAFADFLFVEMPKALAIARDQWGIEEWRLPDPVRYDSYDPLTVDNYPTVGSVVSSVNNFTRRDYDAAMSEEYHATYLVRSFLWARTGFDGQNWEDPAYDSALRIRDDMAAVMRSVILGTPSLNAKNENGESYLRVEETSLREEYFDAIKASQQNGRWLAGVGINFEVVVDESQWRPIVGMAESIDVSAGLLDDQP